MSDPLAGSCGAAADGVWVAQPSVGVRYGAEAFWLVGFALDEGVPHTAADLGTGCGAIALLLAGHGVHAWGVDRRQAWRPFWDRSIQESQLRGSVRLEVGDVLDARPPQPVDLVVCNPPFFPKGFGLEPTCPWRRAARFDASATLTDFVRAAEDMLRPGGRACFVVSVEREAELRAAATLPITREARVGRKRVLLQLGGKLVPGTVHVPDRGPEVDRWYAIARRNVVE